MAAREQPYADMHHFADVAFMKMQDPAETLRPQIPPYCPLVWAMLMKKCWAFDPHKRPTMKEVNHTLSEYLRQCKNVSDLALSHDPHQVATIYQPFNQDNLQIRTTHRRLTVESPADVMYEYKKIMSFETIITPSL